MNADFLSDIHVTWERILGVVLSIFGGLFISSALISFLVTAFGKRVEQVKEGRNRYPHKDHAVVLGWDASAPALIESLIKDSSEVIVLAEDSATAVRDKVRGALNGQEGQKVIVYHGTLDSPEDIASLSLQHATCIIILGTFPMLGRDSRNLEISRLVDAHLKSLSKRVPCHVHIRDPESYALLERVYVNDSDLGIELLPFNFHADWARQVLVGFDALENNGKRIYTVLDYKPITEESDKTVHFAIVGFGRMGRAMLLQALRLCHYANGSTTHITVIDFNAEILKQEFLATYPSVGQIDNIELNFMSCAIESSEARNMLKGLVDSTKHLLTVAVCIRNPDDALQIGLTLPATVLRSESPILIRQEMSIGFAELIKQRNETKLCQNLLFFGDHDQCTELNQIRDKLAQAYHEVYLEERRNKNTFDDKDPVCQSWEKLALKYRQTNRNLADLIPLKIRSIGCYAQASKKSKLYQVPVVDVEVLARIEHNRWAADRLLSGWQVGPEKNEELMISPYLVPYDHLAEEIKEYDRIPARVIPKILTTHLKYFLEKEDHDE